jgi:hypothetical protein
LRLRRRVRTFPYDEHAVLAGLGRLDLIGEGLVAKDLRGQLSALIHRV